MQTAATTTMYSAGRVLLPVPVAIAAAISGPGPPISARPRLNPIALDVDRVSAGNSSTSMHTVVTLTIDWNTENSTIPPTTPAGVPVPISANDGMATTASPNPPTRLTRRRPIRSDSIPASGVRIA